MSDTTPTTPPKEIGELVTFLCALGKVIGEAYGDDKKITLLEMAGMVTLLREAIDAFNGLENVDDEIKALTPYQVEGLVSIPAHYFHKLIPAQHEIIAQSALACLPTLVQLVQVIRNSAALAAEFPGRGEDAPRATHT